MKLNSCLGLILTCRGSIHWNPRIKGQKESQLTFYVNPSPSFSEVGAHYVTSVRHVEWQKCNDSHPGFIHFTHVVCVSQDDRPPYSRLYFNRFEYLLPDVPLSDRLLLILLPLTKHTYHRLIVPSIILNKSKKILSRFKLSS